MTQTISRMDTSRPMERWLDHDVEKAIEQQVGRLIDVVFWCLNEEGGLELDRVREILEEEDPDEMAGDQLSLEQRVEAIERGMDEEGEDDLTLTFTSLRTELESQAAHYIHQLAVSRALELFTELCEAMLDNGLEPEQMRVSNPFAWQAHRAERDEGPFVVYEYCGVEDPGQDVEVWEYELLDAAGVFFLVHPDEA